MRTRRAYQEQAFWANRTHPTTGKPGLRRYMLAWLRQGGKSTTLSEQSLLEMADHPGRLITFATASLNLGGEMPEKEAQLWSAFLRDMRSWADERKMQLVGGYRRHQQDADSWKEFPDDIDIPALADVLEHSKFEVRLRHSQTISSRLKVIAANVQTARGFTGSVKLDEAPFVPDLQTLLQELEPIFSTDPTFCFLMAGTPPPDYSDYAYELFTEVNGREAWPTDAKGHWFRNSRGWWVHRVTIDDAAAAGRKIFHPETGEVITPDEAREASDDKEGWDRSNRLIRPKMGRSAISPVAMSIAQQKGRDRGHSSEWLPEETELPPGSLDHVQGTVTMGIDLGTTEGKKSNPTSLALQRTVAGDTHAPLILRWKTASPEVTRSKIRMVILECLRRGILISSAGIDATNERNFARIIAAENPEVEWHLLIGSEGLDKTDTDGLPINVKQAKGDLLSTAGESHRLILPFDKYLTTDFGRVLKDRGTYQASVGPAGEHGDTFDALAAAMFVDGRESAAESLDVGRGIAAGPARSRNPAWEAQEYNPPHYA
jgi:hypothetical protein